MTSILKNALNNFDKEKFKKLNAEMSFSEYLEMVHQKPFLLRNAWQTLYDMIMEKGTDTIEEYRKTYVRYKFFDNPENPIIGLTPTKDAIVKFIKGAAGGYGTEKRILLLHGPVGSSKSTICRLLKREMEKFSKTDFGAWYSYKWVNLPTGSDGIYTEAECNSPMHEQPLKLLPLEVRLPIIEELNRIMMENAPEERRADLYTLKCNDELNPLCKKFMNMLLKKYDGDLEKVLENHIKVVRKVYSEADRCGIATFQPKDEKNQDSTELTGDINFRQIGNFGSDSDPRAFNFDGEFCVGNRGLIEFIEALKLDTSFLYDLLGASQEQSIKPKKFSQVNIDEAIIAHTNDPEFQKLKSDQYMEAFRDRTNKVDVPYTLKWSEELKILEKDYGPGKVKHHIAPHTLEIAALWSVLTRLDDDKEGKISLTEKAELYDGKLLPGWTEDAVKEMKDKYPDEGMTSGMSIRYLQDKISNCLSNHHDYVNMFMVLNELKDGLENSSLLSNKEHINKYMTCVDLCVKKLTEILSNEVQKALVGDEDAIIRLCANYIDNLMAYNGKAKIKDPITGQDRKPDERLMRQVEEKIQIPDTGVDDFRGQIAMFMADLAHKGKQFKWDSNQKLKKAFEAKLFEDVKDTIKLSALSVNGSSVVDKNIQEKIDAIKTRLIRQYGYNERSARDVLDFVGGIFARGDLAEDD
ncbi:MAG: serine protein kinase [bacterium]